MGRLLCYLSRKGKYCAHTHDSQHKIDIKFNRLFFPVHFFFQSLIFCIIYSSINTFLHYFQEYMYQSREVIYRAASTLYIIFLITSVISGQISSFVKFLIIKPFEALILYSRFNQFLIFLRTFFPPTI